VDGDGIGVHATLKAAVAEAGLADRVRVNRSGCFSQCGNGPMVVVYPEGVWYAAVSPADAPEIVDRHLLAGEPVERLRFRPGTMGAHKLERDADGRPMGRSARWPTPGRTEPE
jgi:(2Fe-2S) ferredoxin